VAKLAGVSQSALSRTFTVGASVPERTRKKVIKAAKALGYSPNILPRILQTNRSRLVAIVIGEMSNPYYTRVLELWPPRLFSRPHLFGAWSELMHIFQEVIFSNCLRISQTKLPVLAEATHRYDFTKAEGALRISMDLHSMKVVTTGE
jgi:hypothetical protein